MKPDVLAHICHLRASMVRWKVETEEPLQLHGPDSLAYVALNNRKSQRRWEVGTDSQSCLLTSSCLLWICVPELICANTHRDLKNEITERPLDKAKTKQASNRKQKTNQTMSGPLHLLRRLQIHFRLPHFRLPHSAYPTSACPTPLYSLSSLETPNPSVTSAHRLPEDRCPRPWLV